MESPKDKLPDELKGALGCLGLIVGFIVFLILFGRWQRKTAEEVEAFGFNLNRVTMEVVGLTREKVTTEKSSISYPCLIADLDEGGRVSCGEYKRSKTDNWHFPGASTEIFKTLRSLVIRKWTTSESQQYREQHSGRTRTFSTYGFDVWVIDLSAKRVTAAASFTPASLPGGLTERLYQGRSMGSREVGEIHKQEEEQVKRWLESLRCDESEKQAR
jgi:hypothetical protein